MKTQTDKPVRIQTAQGNRSRTIAASQDALTRQIGSKVEEEDRSEPSVGRNIIVAIGINQYQHQPQLNNPINDAQAVLALFKQCGFQELPVVPSLVSNDATRAAIADLPNRLAAELAPDDNLVVFFAGHGEKVERQAPDPAQPGKAYTHRTGYLIPVDGPMDRPGEWIKLDSFLEEISGLPARHIFVILDACKSGIALADKFKVKGGDQPTAVAALRQLPSRRVLTSARHDEKAAEGGSGSGHSVFAEALIAAVQDRQADRDGDGYIKTVDLFSFVQDRVSERAKKLFRLKQTPDYGYLPGDGSGDLVISLREGVFNRLIQEALGVMLRHDVPRLEELVDQLIAANPTYPITLYLQFRLKLMQRKIFRGNGRIHGRTFVQGDVYGALDIIHQLQYQNLSPGTLPLSQAELTALSIQLAYWGEVFSIPAAKPAIEITLLTGKNPSNLHSAPLIDCAAGNAWQIEDGTVAQFQVTNLGDAPVHLYFITIVPHGRLMVGPLLDPSYFDMGGLPPREMGIGRPFRVQGLPGSVTETLIFCSPEILWNWMSPPDTSMRGIARFEAEPVFQQMQMLTILYQIPEALPQRPVDIRSIESAFAI